MGDDTCLRYGSLNIMSKPVNKVGMYEFGDNVEVEVKNSKTYSRVTLRSDILLITVGPIVQGECEKWSENMMID